MGNRTAGDVYVMNSAANASFVTNAGGSVTPNNPPLTILVCSSAATSGGVVFMSVDCTGAQNFGVCNQGSINIFITGSFDGTSFVPSVNVYRHIGGGTGLTSAVECVSASTIATFAGPYVTLRVVANSGSGVYRASLSYR